MRGLVLKAPAPIESRPLEARELPVPEPTGSLIRIRVRACGLCRTDLHEIEGELPLPRLPLVPGHQIAGTVDALGPVARRFRAGERVGLAWLQEACGACEFCGRGDENLCELARFTGYHSDGGYAEFVLAPEAFCFKIPESRSDVQAAPLLCAGIIGYRALKMTGPRPGETLGLFGFGASAHIALQVARDMGLEAWVFTRGQEHRELARSLGASWTGTIEEEPPGLLDRAVAFAPAGALIPAALSRLKRGGTLALAGIHLDRIPEMPYSLLYGERVLRSVTAATRRDAEELLSLAERVPVKIEAEVFSLEEAGEALIRLKAGSIRGAAVLTF